MSGQSAADREIRELATTLAARMAELGEGYWSNEEVQALQVVLRSRIGAYGAWEEDRLPMHQRARMAARYESELAHLLWPR